MSELAERLHSLEIALARRDGTAIPGGLAALIDDDFAEIGASGRRWDRAAILELLGSGPAEDVAIDGPPGKYRFLATLPRGAAAAGGGLEGLVLVISVSPP